VVADPHRRLQAGTGKRALFLPAAALKHTGQQQKVRGEGRREGGREGKGGGCITTGPLGMCSHPHRNEL